MFGATGRVTGQRFGELAFLDPMLLDIARGIRHLIYPAVCVRCRELLSDAQGDFCRNCALQLTTDPHFTCPRCASTVGEYEDVSLGCQNCRDARFAFQSVFRLGPYDGALRDVVLSMKHRSGEVLAECVGRLWANQHASRFRQLGVDLVIPVPLHWFRRLRRGFNQTEALSSAVARELRVEHRPGWLRRIRPTRSQANLPASERPGNVRGAFRLARNVNVSGRSILLIDDVLTTGSTLHETARPLVAGKAKSVCAAVLAHR